MRSVSMAMVTEAEDCRADEARTLYHECVEEIKSENAAIMGSLQLHNEAMKRLKQRQVDQAMTTNDDEPMTKVKPKRFRSSLGKSLRVSEFAKSLRVNDLTLSLHQMIPRGSSTLSRGDSWNANKRSCSDPSNDEVMPGRRRSTMVTGIDHEIIAAQVLEDLELSEDESEDEAMARLMRDNSTGNNSCRPSFIRRTSSLITKKGMRRLSLSTSHASSSRRNSAVSFEGSKSNEERGGASKTGDQLKGESSSPNNGEEVKSVKEQPPAIRKRSHARTGRRRSSLFSVEETSTSTNFCGVERSSFNSRGSINSLGNSLTEESLQGSFYEANDGSLICSFGHMDSWKSSSGCGNNLICDWDKRNSWLSNSGVLSIQEELLDNGEELLDGDEDSEKPASLPPTALNEKSNRSLLCDWNESQSMLTNSAVSLHLTSPGDLNEEDEKILLQAKESCSLFNVRNE